MKTNRRRTVLLVTASLLIAVQGLFADESRSKLARRPNIVIIMADDMGWSDLGCYGGEIPTPHIDSIAADGIRFTDGYVTAPYCSASRAGLMTGRFPARFGYEFNPIGAHNEDPDAGLPASEVTLARHLHDAGCATALVGKWHLGGHAKYHPLRRGFDEFFGFMHEGHFLVSKSNAMPKGVGIPVRTSSTFDPSRLARWILPALASAQ